MWEKLTAQLPDDVVLLHGQRLTDDRNDVEIDILVLWPGLGALVLEVKGGVVGIDDGRWYTGSAHARHPLRRSPLEQAMIGKNTLYKYLKGRLSVVFTPVVHAAVLPYTFLPDDWDVPDAPRDRLFDGRDLDVLGERIAALLTEAFDPDRDSPFIPIDPTVGTRGGRTPRWRTCPCSRGRSRTPRIRWRSSRSGCCGSSGTTLGRRSAVGRAPARRTSRS